MIRHRAIPGRNKEIESLTTEANSTQTVFSFDVTPPTQISTRKPEEFLRCARLGEPIKIEKLWWELTWSAREQRGCGRAVVSFIVC